MAKNTEESESELNMDLQIVIEKLQADNARLSETVKFLEIAFAKSQDMYNRHIADLHVGIRHNG